MKNFLNKKINKKIKIRMNISKFKMLEKEKKMKIMYLQMIM